MTGTSPGCGPSAVTTSTKALFQDVRTVSRLAGFVMHTTLGAQLTNFGDGSKLCGYLASYLIRSSLQSCSTEEALKCWLHGLKAGLHLHSPELHNFGRNCNVLGEIVCHMDCNAICMPT